MFAAPYVFMLSRFGRTLTLKRERPALMTATLSGKVRYVKPDEIVGGVLQNDLMIVTTPPNSPPWDGSLIKKGDRIIDGTKLVTVEFFYPLYEGDALVAYRLICRG